MQSVTQSKIIFQRNPVLFRYFIIHDYVVINMQTQRKLYTNALVLKTVNYIHMICCIWYSISLL